MSPEPELLLAAEEVAARVDRAAERIAPLIDDNWRLVCLLTGGLWYAADLARALFRLGRNPLFDALWLSSYGGARQSSGAISLRANFQHPIAGHDVLLVDEVIDSGLSLTEAKRLALASGASKVLTTVFARKPWPRPRHIEPDVVAWEAPARFLVGYGMDVGGRYRGLSGVAALPTGPETT